LGKRSYRELESRLRNLLLHLLKQRFQPEKRSKSWDSSVITQPAELDTLCEQSPSVRRAVPRLLPRAYRIAVRKAAIQIGLAEDTFPPECPFGIEEVLGPEDSQ
jgi:hypothetical protein